MSPSENGEGDQGRLFDEPDPDRKRDESVDDPASNSPEDLGYKTPNAPPEATAYGKPEPEPDPMPENFARSAMQHDDAKKFRDWIYEQGLPTHRRVTFGGIVVGLSGLGKPDLRWLCQAIKQARRAPSPELMRRAVMTHDVSVLREDDGDDYAIGTPLSV